MLNYVLKTTIERHLFGNKDWIYPPIGNNIKTNKIDDNRHHAVRDSGIPVMRNKRGSPLTATWREWGGGI